MSKAQIGEQLSSSLLLASPNVPHIQAKASRMWLGWDSGGIRVAQRGQARMKPGTSLRKGNLDLDKSSAEECIESNEDSELKADPKGFCRTETDKLSGNIR